MSSTGPHIPEHLLPTVSAADTEESDEDDYAPALPPELAAARKVAGPSAPSPSPKRAIGPSLPTAPDFDRDSGSDSDDVGPQPLPSGSRPTTESGVQEFLEREAQRRKNVAEAAQPKKLEREAWMLAPPKAGDLRSLDPTKLKARQFGRGATTRDADGSLWTETPAERQQRLADEVSGRKRRAVNAEPVVDDEDARKRRKRDADIRRDVDAHTRKVRGPALVDVHMQRAQTKDEGEPGVIWDHARDMSLGGRLMDDSQRQKLVRDAKGLGDRFGTGKSGGFL